MRLLKLAALKIRGYLKVTSVIEIWGVAVFFNADIELTVRCVILVVHCLISGDHSLHLDLFESLFLLQIRVFLVVLIVFLVIMLIILVILIFMLYFSLECVQRLNRLSLLALTQVVVF